MCESPATVSESTAATPDAMSSARAQGILSRCATALLTSGADTTESAGIFTILAVLRLATCCSNNR
jgi:hypothetical protein